MDVNETLRRCREAMAKIYNSPSGAGGDDLAYAFEDLDDWLSKGGFLPADWSANRAPVGR